MKVKVLASGSKGNATIVLCDDTKILIDVGISYTQIKRMLEDNQLNILDFDALLITHNHSDHIRGLSTLIKHTNIEVYIPEAMYQDLEQIVPRNRCVFIDDTFQINDVFIELIHTSHDTNCSVGYIIKHQEKELVYVTDTGYINRRFLKRMKNKDIYVLESNHDEVMLMDGPYPRYLKERVISDRGHLSNKTASKYLENAVGDKTKYVVLAHISEKNNTEELAYQETKNVISNNDIEVLIAKQEEETKFLEV